MLGWARIVGGSVLGVVVGLLLAPSSNDLVGAAALGLVPLVILPVLCVGPGWGRRGVAFVVHGILIAVCVLVGLGLQRPIDLLCFLTLDVALLGAVSSYRPSKTAVASLFVLLAPFEAVADCPPQAPLFGLPLSPAGRDPLARSNLRRFAFDDDGHRTDAVVVLRDGELVFEAYANGFGASTPHLTWSVSKSVSSALLGIAVHEGRVRLEDSVCAHLDAPSALCAIQVVDLLRWSSGLDWTETYEEADSPQISSVIAMLYGEGRHGMTDFVLGHSLRSKPGETWMYSSGDAHLMMAVTRAVMEPVHGPLFPWATLFAPLGMEAPVFERDGHGDFAGASYFHATARDLARFGQLFLQDGCWDGRRLLPAGWVDEAGRVSAPFLRDRVARRDPTDVGGRSWWLNRPVPEAGIEKPWASLPEDALVARGHWGQYLIVAPRQRVVAVRFGEDRGGQRFDIDTFGRLALAAAGVAP